MINGLLRIAILLFLVKFSQEARQYNTISDCMALLYKLSRSANKNYENDSVNRNAFKCHL